MSLSLSLYVYIYIYRRDSRLNDLLRWFFFSCSVLASWIQKLSLQGEQIGSFMAQWTIDSVTSRVLQIEKMHGALKPLQAFALFSPHLLPFLSSFSGLKPLLHDTGHHTWNKNEARRLENWTCCQAAVAVFSDSETAGRTRLGSFILANVNTVIAGVGHVKKVIGNGNVIVWYFF